MKTSRDRNTPFGLTLANGLKILQCFSEGRQYLGNSDICRLTGMEKSKVSRLTKALCNLGYLKRTPVIGRFELSLAVLSLSYSKLIHLPIRELAHPFMQEMADRFNAAVNLGMRDRLDIVFIESCRKISTLPNRPEIGRRCSLYASEVGPMFLAGLPDGMRQDIYKQVAAVDAKVISALKQVVVQRAKELDKQRFCYASKPGRHSVATTFKCGGEGDYAVINCVVEESAMSKQILLTDVTRELLSLVSRIEDPTGSRVHSF